MVLAGGHITGISGGKYYWYYPLGIAIHRNSFPLGQTGVCGVGGIKGGRVPCGLGFGVGSHPAWYRDVGKTKKKKQQDYEGASSL